MKDAALKIDPPAESQDTKDQAIHFRLEHELEDLREQLLNELKSKRHILSELRKLRKDTEYYSHIASERANLQYLLYTTKELTRIDSMEIMLDLCLERLGNIFKEWHFAFVIEDALRDSVILVKNFYQMTDGEQNLVMEHHNAITNELENVTINNDANTGLFADDSSTPAPAAETKADDDFFFVIAATETPKVVADDEKSNAKTKIYGTVKKEVTKLMNENDGNEWIVLPGDIGDRHIMKIFIKARDIDKDSIATIRLFMSLVSALIQTHLLKKELVKQANIDQLTGLLNRRGCDEILKTQIYLATHPPLTPFTAIAIDVNGLKEVNDTFGHDYGDKLLTRVAQILISTTRVTDTITRHGGDEFLIICPNTTIKNAQNVTSRIREMEKTSVIEVTVEATGEIKKIPVRMSIGMASTEDVDPEKVLSIADHEQIQDKKEYYKTHQRYR